MEPFQLHAIVQISALLSFILAIYYARMHRLQTHHRFIYMGVALLTVGIAYMVYNVRGFPSIHGKVGFFVYFYVLFTALSGRLFFAKKITRNQHKFLAITAVTLLVLQILFALYNFVF
ncbi:hypothetical protein K1720_01150 [Thermococcus argininiproducens]|uniref:Cytochrome b561 domain-containing protein n=1 Tax=Thermococcus argininiproducens TaxID=2866384 RepID=A0A9E7M9W6_9EURY|nr:hypothetical protein [Thermococcus argininiproducens]USH00122.1 hypothetical protein K1720_01150 [Thermococcus argininiproducens]